MRFLIPVDFTEITNPLLRTAKKVAMPHKAGITLMHTVQPPLYIPYPESLGVNTVDLQLLMEFQENKKVQAKEKLLGLAEFLKPLDVDFYVEVGEPSEAILEKEDGYDLIFVGSHKKGLVERILVGSTTEKVMKYSHRPIFVLKGKEPENFKNILLTYDFSEYAERAINFAVNLFRPMRPGLKLLHVEETIELPLVENIKDNLSAKYREEKEKYIHRLAERLTGEGFEVEIHMVQASSPSAGIEDFVKSHPDIEIVVLGSRGLSGLKRVLLGSTSSRLLKGLEVSMIVHRGV